MDTNNLAWIEVSLTVDGELAEAVADVLARFSSNGVVVESGIKYLNADDPGTPLDQVHVRAYLAMDKDIDEKRRKVEEALWYLGCIQQIPPASFTPISTKKMLPFLYPIKPCYQSALSGK